MESQSVRRKKSRITMQYAYNIRVANSIPSLKADNVLKASHHVITILKWGGGGGFCSSLDISHKSANTPLHCMALTRV